MYTVMNSTYIITSGTSIYVYNGTLIAAIAFSEQLFGIGNATVAEVPAGSFAKV
jgi:hypothetical protein